MNEVAQPAAPTLNRVQSLALATGLIGIVLCALGWFSNPDQFFRSYLVAYLFWIGLALGCLAILMMQYLTGGAWGLVIRRALESAAMTLPLMALLFAPLALGVRSLYVWARPAEVAADHLLQHKTPYLNVTFFLIRAATYFVLWAGAAYFLNRWSQEQDETRDPHLSLRLQRLSGPGLFFLAVTLTFALIDWVMSLEPRWYSTIYGVTFIAGETLAAFAFIIAVFILLSRFQPLSEALLPEHYRALGNLLLTFVMLWAYCAFSQYLLIWSGNLREETPWYLHRLQGGWGWIALALIVLHFFLPFFMLLSGDIKQSARRLSIVAAIVMLMRFVDLFWLIEPAFYQARFHLHWMDFMAVAGIGGLWLAVFASQLKGRSLLPLHDPYAEEALKP